MGMDQCKWRMDAVGTVKEVIQSYLHISHHTISSITLKRRKHLPKIPLRLFAALNSRKKVRKGFGLLCFPAKEKGRKYQSQIKQGKMKIKMSVSIVTIMLLFIPRRASSILPDISPQNCPIALRRNMVHRRAIHVVKIGPWTIKSSRITVGIRKCRKRRIKIEGMLHGRIARVIRNIVILISLRHSHSRHRIALHLRLSLHKGRRIIASKVTVPHHVLIVEGSSIGV